MKLDRYARQKMISGWNQEKLRHARVLVAGAGALGNEVLKNLALLGVGNLIVVDFDRIEHSNLSRTVLFGQADVGSFKAMAAAGALVRLNPGVIVQPIQGNVFYDLGLGYYRHSDLVIGCLDNLGARSQVGLSCTLAGIPYLDGGMWSLGGEVRWFTAGDGPCFDCTLAEDDWLRADERRSCSGFRGPDTEEAGHVATVVTTAAIIGGIMAQEAVKWLSGRAITEGKALVYNGQALTLHRAELSRNLQCRSSHVAYRDVIELPTRAADLTPRQLLQIARFERIPEQNAESPDGEAPDHTVRGFRLELGRDFLLALHCPACGRSEAIVRPWGQVSEDARVCTHCGAQRVPESVRSLDEESGSTADKPLSSLGVPPGEVLAVHTPAGLRLFELTGDIQPRRMIPG